MRGSYLLVAKLEKDRTIHVGKLGDIKFNRGLHVYVGSALNGLEQRIERYFRKNKKMHWHIDYLLKYAEIIDVFYKEKEVKEECGFAKRLGKIL